MFGLMKPSTCCSSANSDFRFHYCGTCKTIGHHYGQSARMLLNYDVVFLSELLGAMSNFKNKKWDQAYYTKSCFALPKQAEAIPSYLQYTAGINVFLTALKTDDNINDNSFFSKIKWIAFRQYFKRRFQQAWESLKESKLPVQKFWDLMQEQYKRESQIIKSPDTPESLINYYAAPTAQMTALTFQNGAQAIQQSNQKEKLYHIGHSFGQINYLLDALEDYQADLKTNTFNGIQSAYQTHSPELPTEIEEAVIQQLHQLKEKTSHHINQLDIKEEKKSYFNNLLQTNLSKRISLQKGYVLQMCGAKEESEESEKKKEEENSCWRDCCDCCGACGDCNCDCPCDCSCDC